MFNPEMMKKYSEVGEKVQNLQQELQQTEIECSTGDGKVVVKMSGTQTPVSVVVSDELCSLGAEAAGAELTTALNMRLDTILEHLQTHDTTGAGTVWSK